MPRPVIAAIAALLVIAGCGDSSATTETAGPPAAADIEGPWQLVQGTLAGQPLRLVDDARVTLIVEDSQASGQAACNHYDGDFDVVDGRVEVGGFGQTLMGCPDAVLALEVAYLSALSKVESAHMDGATLVLTGSPAVELRFERLQPPPIAEIVGTPWLLESIVQADEVSSTVGEQATLTLHEDGSFEGSTGCRTLGGSYTIDGDEILATELRADGECPDDVFAQDSQVIEVLGDGFRAALVGEKLQLTSPGGVWGLVYRAAE